MGLEDFIFDFFLGAALEGLTPREHFIKDAAEGPVVHSMGIAFRTLWDVEVWLLIELWRHIRVGPLVIVDSLEGVLGNAEVNELDLKRVVTNDNIFRFQVLHYNTVGMEGLNTCQNLQSVELHLMQRQFPLHS